MGWLTSWIGNLIGRQDDPSVQVVRDAAMDAGLNLQAIDLSSILGADRMGMFPKSWTPEQAIAHYTRWQFVCATVIAESAMMVPLRVVRMQDGTEDVDGDHALNQLIETVNPLMTREEMVYLAVADCAATGRSYWEIVRDGTGRPAELWPILGKMKPRMQRAANKISVTWEHEYKAENGEVKRQTFANEDILYLRMPKPGTAYGAIGAGQAASGFLTVEEQLTESQWRLFKQGIFSSLLLKVNSPEFQNPRSRDQWMQQLQDKYAGISKTGGVMALPGSTEIHEPGRPNELAYAKSSEIIRDNILAIYRVPGAMLGLSKDVNRASAEALQYAFAEWRIKPMLTLLESRLNQDLAIREYPEDDVRLRFDDPTPANKEAERQLLELDLDKGVRTVNEVRAERGLPEVDWGDRPILPINQAPFGSATPDRDGDGTGQKRQTQQEDGNGWNAEERSRMAIKARDRRSRFEPEYAAAVREVIEDLERDVLEAWELSRQQKLVLRTQELPGPVRTVLNVEQIAEKLADRTAPHNQRGIHDGGNLERELSGHTTPVDDPWVITGSLVADEAARFSARHFADPAETIRKRMADVIERGVQENKSWDGLKADIVAEFGAMKESRAASIAMTETTRLYNGGAAAYRRKYGVEAKQWVCSFVNSRTTHQTADGTVVANGEEFVVGVGRGPHPGAMGAAEEDVNCACMAVGVPTERIRR